MKKVMAFLFALSCLMTATTSSQLLGIGMWYYIILIAGALVFSLQFIDNLIPLARVIAILMVIVSVAAVALTLLAGTIGGSFNMDDGVVLLVLGFIAMAIFGSVVARQSRPSSPVLDKDDHVE